MSRKYDCCDECTISGNDYFVNSHGELECLCPKCTVNRSRYDADWDDDWNDD